mmetsp:Transcript_49769/g.113267  ORF Transcript_49769/g.113267 Transcript_49769/m.113267 type:complete len:241 (+) Transcript_49769:384-1106(+)
MNSLGFGAEFDVLEEAKTFPVDCIVGTKQGSLVVDAGSQVCDKTAGDPQYLVQDEARRRAIPSGESCRRVCRPETAVWEGRAIRLAEEQSLMRQNCLERLRSFAGRPVEVDEGVHFEGTNRTARRATAAAHRKEPMSKGDGTKLTRPLEHSLCQFLHVILAGLSACDQCLLETLVARPSQPSTHGGIVEDSARELVQLVRGAFRRRKDIGHHGLLMLLCVYPPTAETTVAKHVRLSQPMT